MNIRIACATVLAFGLASIAFPFGHEGHEAVGILAMQKLQADAAKEGGSGPATTALAKISAILGNGVGLGEPEVADWADWVRLDETRYLSQSQIDDIEERFPGCDGWHFVDLPLGTPKYTPDAPSAGANDIVDGFRQCILMLETADTSKEKDHHQCALK